jgi:hypothetical protein
MLTSSAMVKNEKSDTPSPFQEFMLLQRITWLYCTKHVKLINRNLQINYAKEGAVQMAHMLPIPNTEKAHGYAYGILH